MDNLVNPRFFRRKTNVFVYLFYAEVFLVFGSLMPLAYAQSNALTAQERLDQDAVAGEPLVAHVTVALCDNQHQGILPVPAALGNGQNPKHNLYWGALYGVKTFLTKSAAWKLVFRQNNPEPKILERIVVQTSVERRGRMVTCYLVADAWDGKHMRQALESFTRHAAGLAPQSMKIEGRNLMTGGSAHVSFFVGHNGLMDLSGIRFPIQAQDAKPRASGVLACSSKSYFEEGLKQSGSFPLILTTSLMAPEAYSLDAALRAWFSGETPAQVREATAQAYHRFQKCGIRGARHLFSAPSPK